MPIFRPRRNCALDIVRDTQITKTKNKRTQLGCWSYGVPTSTGGFLECAHAEERLGMAPMGAGGPVGADSERVHARRPAAKSVKIQSVESESQVFFPQTISAARRIMWFLVGVCRRMRFTPV